MALNFKDRFYITPISKERATEMIVKYHYLHRRPALNYCYGLFDREQIQTKGVLIPTEKLIGVICFGIPASPELVRAICGEEHFKNVIELNRLWIEDGTPPNVESFMVSNTIQMLPDPYDIIVSYADKYEGHVGTIYQATNFLYTGLSGETTEWTLDGKAKHSRHLTDDLSLDEIKKLYGDRFKQGRKSRKHRYIFFKATGGKRKYYMKKLKWEIQPYPKVEKNV